MQSAREKCLTCCWATTWRAARSISPTMATNIWMSWTCPDGCVLPGRTLNKRASGGPPKRAIRWTRSAAAQFLRCEENRWQRKNSRKNSRAPAVGRQRRDTGRGQRTGRTHRRRWKPTICPTPPGVIVSARCRRSTALSRPTAGAVHDV